MSSDQIIAARFARGAEVAQTLVCDFAEDRNFHRLKSVPLILIMEAAVKASQELFFCGGSPETSGAAISPVIHAHAVRTTLITE